jgi:chorismate mutase/prephenate dehydratase
MAKRTKRASKKPGAKRGARGGGGSKSARRRKVAGATSLDDLRVAIDAVDRRLIELLNERSRLVVEVGRVKRAAGIPIYAPHRESEVIDRMIALNKGPLPARAIEGIYREIMSGSFALEQPLRIAYLGPPGSFSHLAAVRHFGSSVAHQGVGDVAGVFTEVERGHMDYGLVPIENSLHGGIVETLDSFMAAAKRSSPVRIYAEVQLEVHHALLGLCDPADVRQIYSKPEVFSQCRHWLAGQYPRAELIPTPSSSRAVQAVKEMGEQAQKEGRPMPPVAAIGSTLAAELYGVHVLFDEIEDSPGNVTRFFVIGRHTAQRSGDDKTSVMFTTLDKPGALVEVLAEFQKAGVNLTHIDKRPSGRNNWTYTFFIDAQGHESDPAVAAALAGARAHCQELVTLGSYPRSKRIL